MLDAQVFSHKSVLSPHIVKESDFREWLDIRVGGGRRLSIAEQCGNDNEILLWAQNLVFAYEPFVVGDSYKQVSVWPLVTPGGELTARKP